MGRFSQVPTSSSSSSSFLTSTFRQRSGSCNGFPKKCFYGLDPVMRTSTTADNPGRRFFGCRKWDDGGYHIMKWWDEAMMEEFHELKLRVDQNGEQVDYIFLCYAEINCVTNLHDEIKKAQAEIAQLNELLTEKPSSQTEKPSSQTVRGAKYEYLMVAGAVIIVPIILRAFGFL